MFFAFSKESLYKSAVLRQSMCLLKSMLLFIFFPTSISMFFFSYNYTAADMGLRIIRQNHNLSCLKVPLCLTKSHVRHTNIKNSSRHLSKTLSQFLYVYIQSLNGKSATCIRFTHRKILRLHHEDLLKQLK